MKTKKRSLPLIIMLVFLLVVAGCSQNSNNTTKENNQNQSDEKTSESSEPKMGGKLIAGMGADVTQLDAHIAGVASDRIPLLHMQETLVTVDDGSNIKPLLASEWEVLNDGASYKFKLREGVKFHNGKEMTAEDVKYSMERFVKVSPRIGEFPIKTITIENPYTIQIDLEGPNGAFLAALANPFVPAVIMPANIEEDQGGKINNPIGTGPYQFVEWVPGQSFTMKRFDDYQVIEGETVGFGGKKVAYFDEVVLRTMADPAVRVSALESGEIQFASDIPPNEFQRLSNNQELKTYNVQSLAWGIILMGFKKPPMDNDKLRKAVSYAVDIEEITNAALLGTAEPSPSSVSKQMTAWFTKAHEEHTPYDKEKAKELIKESGYNGEKIVITASKAYQHHERSAVVLQQQLKDVGLNVEIEFLDWPTWQSTRWNTGDYNIILSHITPRPDPSAIYYSYLHSKFNANGYNNAELDALLQKGLQSVDQEERKKIYEEIHKLIVDDVPWISTYALPTIEATQGIEGYNGWPYGYPRFWNVWFQ